jgi:hypothetical protein
MMTVVFYLAICRYSDVSCPNGHTVGCGKEIIHVQTVCMYIHTLSQSLQVIPKQ